MRLAARVGGAISKAPAQGETVSVTVAVPVEPAGVLLMTTVKLMGAVAPDIS